MKSKKIKITIIISVCVLLALGILLGYLIPFLNAKTEYDSIVNPIKEKNNELISLIEDSQSVVDSKEKCIDESLYEKTQSVIDQSKSQLFDVGEMPFMPNEIIKKTNSFKNINVDYANTIEDLKKSKTNLEKNIKGYKFFESPDEARLAESVKKVSEVSEVEICTEEKDRNNKLHKPGGYTMRVDFTLKNIKSNKSGTPCELGVDGGGAFDVFSNEDDAQSRAKYLGAFAGGILDSGSIRLIGNTVIRLSHELNASQQKDIEQKIIDAIISI